MKILFVYEHKYPQLWKDGLWATLNLLEKDGFEIEKQNLSGKPPFALSYPQEKGFDFVLGWGAFNSSVDRALQNQITYDNKGIKKGLCLGGYANYSGQQYDILFYEVEKWGLEWLKKQRYTGKTQHAFGVNTDIYKPIPNMSKIFDWLTVGAFATWKRQYLLRSKTGYRLAIGEIQKENLSESIDILGDLILEGVAVSDMVDPERLTLLYNMSKNIYLPANTFGGSERAVLESRSCRIPVEVESDNPKLIELTTGPIWDHYYYFNALKNGILNCF